MISNDLALALHAAGLDWHPKAGDQFRVQAEALTEEVFTLSHMVIEPRTYDTGTVLNFNGTTEWALDNVSQDETLWLPREDQLRELLGGTFVSLERIEDGYAVTTCRPGEDPTTHTAEVVEDAYAEALLALIRLAVDA